MKYILAEVKKEATVGVVCLLIYLTVITYRTRLFQEIDKERALGIVTSAVALLVLGTCIERIRLRASQAREEEKDREPKE